MLLRRPFLIALVNIHLECLRLNKMTMKKLNLIGIIFLLGLLFSCNKDEELTHNGLTQDQEAKNLNELFSEIESLSASKNCDAPSWTFTSSSF